jgi:hypothetical protein
MSTLLKPASWVLDLDRLSPEALQLWRDCRLAFPLWDSGQRLAEDVGPHKLHGAFGTALLVGDWAGSEYGPAVVFGGASGDVITVPDPAANLLDGCADLTVEILFRPTNVTGLHGLVGKYQPATGLRSWRLYQNGTDLELQVSTDGAANEIQTTVGAALAVSTWYHVVATFRAGTFALYLNGRSATVDANFAATSIFGGTHELTIGQRVTSGGSSSDVFLGQIAGLRIWQRALSSWETQWLYDHQWEMYDPGIFLPFPAPGYALEHGAGAAEAGPWIDAGTVLPGAQALLIARLEAGVSYDVQVRTRDTSGNTSSGSTIQTVTPTVPSTAWSGVRQAVAIAARPSTIRRRLNG